MQGITIYDSHKPGPTTVIVGCIHGNEIVGEHSLNYLTKKIKTTKYTGKIIALFANLKAFKKKVRFIDSDLNRSFKNCARKDSYEYKRAQEIKTFFRHQKIDYIFDLHSTSSKSDPMVICANQKSSLEFSKYIPLKYVIQGLIAKKTASSLLGYFQNKIKMGMAFECGCHNEKKTLAVGKKIIEVILDFVLKKPLIAYKNQKTIRVKKQVVVKDPAFTFSKKYKGFEMLKKGEVRAAAGKKKYKTSAPQIVIMPNQNIRQEIEKKGSADAVYLGKLL